MKKEVSYIKVEKEPQNINFCQARNQNLTHSTAVEIHDEQMNF